MDFLYRIWYNKSMFNKPLSMLEGAKKNSPVLFKKLYEWEEYLFLKNLAEPSGNVENPKELFKFLFDIELEKNQQLPEEIKSKIADLRVFTLGYATQEVIDLINEKMPPRQ